MLYSCLFFYVFCPCAAFSTTCGLRSKVQDEPSEEEKEEAVGYGEVSIEALSLNHLTPPGSSRRD